MRWGGRGGTVNKEGVRDNWTVTWASLDTVFRSRSSFLALLRKTHTQVSQLRFPAFKLIPDWETKMDLVSFN